MQLWYTFLGHASYLYYSYPSKVGTSWTARAALFGRFIRELRGWTKKTHAKIYIFLRTFWPKTQFFWCNFDTLFWATPSIFITHTPQNTIKMHWSDLRQLRIAESWNAPASHFRELKIPENREREEKKKEEKKKEEKQLRWSREFLLLFLILRKLAPLRGSAQARVTKNFT